MNAVSKIFVSLAIVATFSLSLSAQKSREAMRVEVRQGGRNYTVDKNGLWYGKGWGTIEGFKVQSDRVKETLADGLGRLLGTPSREDTREHEESCLRQALKMVGVPVIAVTCCIGAVWYKMTGLDTKELDHDVKIGSLADRQRALESEQWVVKNALQRIGERVLFHERCHDKLVRMGLSQALIKETPLRFAAGFVNWLTHLSARNIDAVEKVLTDSDCADITTDGSSLHTLLEGLKK